MYYSEESSRTLFEVLGLKAYKSSKMPCLWPRTALFVDLLKMGRGHYHFFSSWSTPETSRVVYEDLFFSFGERLNFDENVRYFCAKTFFLEGRALALCFLGPWPLAFPGLDRVCPRKVGPWPRINFVSLASSLVFAIPPIIVPARRLFKRVRLRSR